MALNLTEAMAVVAIQKKLPFTTYKTLCEWLGCYNFIPRSQRALHPVLLNTLMEYLECSSSSLFQLWLVVDMIEVTLTLEQQENISSWMNDSKHSVTPIDWSYIRALESFN